LGAADLLGPPQIGLQGWDQELVLNLCFQVPELVLSPFTHYSENKFRGVEENEKRNSNEVIIKQWLYLYHL